MVHNSITDFVKKSIKRLKGTYGTTFKSTRLEEEITCNEPSYTSIASVDQFVNSTEPLLHLSTDSGIDEKQNKKAKKPLQFSTEVVCHSSDDEFRISESDNPASSDELHSSDNCPLNTSVSSIEGRKPGILETPVYSPIIKVKVKESQTPKPNHVFIEQGSNSSLGTEYFESPVTQNTNLEHSEESLYSVPTPLKFRNQNAKNKIDFFTKEDLEPLNLIHQTNWTLPDALTNAACHNEEPKPPKDEKFVVNLFESRPSKRWVKSPINVDYNKIAKETEEDLDKDLLEDQIKQLEETFRNLELQSQSLQRESTEQEAYGNTLIKYMNSQEYKTFKELRRERDVECVRMSQVSKALLEMKKNAYTGWCEELVAERLLLEADEKVTLLTNKIRETYTELKSAAHHTGTIQLSDISFPLKCSDTKMKESKYFTDFYVMTVSYDCHLLTSNFVMAGENSVDFYHGFTFGNIDSDFELKVRLFCVKLRTSKDIKEKFMEKFGHHLCATSKIIYEDINTREIQETIVLKPSFKLVAETTLTRAHLEATTSILNATDPSNNKFQNEAHFNLNVQKVNLENSNYSGFLTVGRKNEGKIYWERKWCVLTAPMLMIYNYPNDEDFENPCEQINLKYCFGPIASKATSCPRSNAFNLKTGVPHSFNNGNESKSLKTKPNFNLEKFYFKADTFGDYVRWTREVNHILGSLKDWKSLEFSQEYYEYVRL